MSDIKIKFRGVRGSFPVANRNFLQYGGNTSCVEINAGNHTIILDAGTGIVALGDDLTENYISSSLNPEQRKPICANILLSHIHMDHIQGLVFFKPMHIKSAQLNVYGAGSSDLSLKGSLKELLFGRTFPLDLGDVACNCNIQDLAQDLCLILKPNQTPKFGLENDAGEDDVVISYYKSYVHPQEGVIIYKIAYKNKSVVYATDKECYFGGDKKFLQFAKNCDVLIHDAQYTAEDYLNPNSPKQGYGHSTYDMALEIGKQANAQKVVFFHYEPSYNDEKINRLKEHYASVCPNCEFAFEGLELEI